MSSTDPGGLYTGASGRVALSWTRLQGAVSIVLPRRVRDANKLAQKVKLDPTMRKRR